MQTRLAAGTGVRPDPRALPAPESMPRAFLGQDPAVNRVLETAFRLARGDQPVLILGETGTGKELVARAIHRASPRAAGPFLALNCASLPAGLLEAEVFGAARGAYTGADAPRPGLLEAAHGGTLLLDEVGDMPPALQAGLLRVLEDGVCRRIGETAERRTDFRLLAATNRDLGRLVDEGRFRADLYYRLGRTLLLPPLRERPDDVPLLARAFLLEAAGGGPPALLAPDAEEWLASHRFPGNVRELRSRILAAASLAEGGVVRRADLAGDEDGSPGRAPAPSGRLREDRVLDALRRREPASTAALVRETGLPRRTVQRVLSDLVHEGGLIRDGRGPATRYVLPHGVRD